MLEIIIIIALWRSLGRKARAKGLKPLLYQLLLVLFWIGGEVFGAIVGAVITRGENQGVLYLGALLGAALGACAAFLLVKLVPAVEAPPPDEATVQVFE